MKGIELCKLCAMFKKCMKPENLHRLSSYTQCPEWIERLMVKQKNKNTEGKDETHITKTYKNGKDTSKIRT